jgi:histone acetyltransferase
VGGICYRPNPEKEFIEIAFLAISSLEQVKGFGTRLMNKLKDHCKKDGYKYFLTYADNNAIGYFKKQGFHKNLKMPKEQYREYIKDYDGGTLMEAEIDQKIDYSNLSDILKQQKDCIVRYCQKFLNVKRKHTYQEFELELEKKGLNMNLFETTDKEKNEKNEKDDKKDIEITKELFDCIPGIKESGWTFEEYKNQCEKEKQGENVNFLTQCRNIINKLKNQEKSREFREPVDKNLVPDYYQTITEPMDLSTLEKGVESGKYKYKIDFEKDLRKIFNNARKYNGPTTHYYKDAIFLENFIEQDLKKLKEC